MLGVNYDGNNVLAIVANFLIVFLSQMAFELFDMLPKGAFPTAFGFYKATITALVSTFIIFGINKATHKVGDSE